MKNIEKIIDVQEVKKEFIPGENSDFSIYKTSNNLILIPRDDWINTKPDEAIDAHLKYSYKLIKRSNNQEKYIIESPTICIEETKNGKKKFLIVYKGLISKYDKKTAKGHNLQDYSFEELFIPIMIRTIKEGKNKRLQIEKDSCFGPQIEMNNHSSFFLQHKEGDIWEVLIQKEFLKKILELDSQNCKYKEHPDNYLVERMNLLCDIEEHIDRHTKAQYELTEFPLVKYTKMDMARYKHIEIFQKGKAILRNI